MSRDDVVARLRKQNIAVTAVHEGGSAGGGRSRLKSFIFALALLAGAALMSTMAKGMRIRCTRAGAAYDCTIETLMGGYRPLYAEDVRGVREVTQERREGVSGKRGRAASSRVVMAGEKRTIATEWLQSALPTSAQVVEALNRELARGAASAEAWQIEAAPMGVALVFGIVGLVVLFRALRA